MKPPGVSPEYGSEPGAAQLGGSVESATVPEPLGTGKILAFPWAVVSTPGSDAPPAGVTVTVARAIQPPKLLLTYPTIVPFGVHETVKSTVTVAPEVRPE
jgi:hypothetical protein